MKIKVKYGTANKIVNVERTLDNIYETFKAELEKKYPAFKFSIVYKGDGTVIKIVDSASLKSAIEHCIEHKQPFLQLEGEDEAPKEEPKKEEPKVEPKKEEPKVEPKKEEPKVEPKKEEPKAQTTPSTPAKTATQPRPQTTSSNLSKQTVSTPVTPSKPAAAPQQTPKFCSNCGAKLAGGKFCQECGTKIEGNVEVPTSQPQRKSTPPPSALEEDMTLCPKCGKPVESGTKALGKFWHHDCFTCSICGEKFGGNRRVMEDNGKPICSVCYHETCAQRCFKCGKEIEGKYLIVDNHNYHPQCFVCTRCGKPFNGSYLLLNGQPVCKKCI